MSTVWPFENPFRPAAMRGKRLHASQLNKLCTQLVRSADGTYFGQMAQVRNWTPTAEQAENQKCSVFDSVSYRWYCFGVNAGNEPVGVYMHPSRLAHIENNALTLPISDDLTPTAAATDGQGRIVVCGTPGSASANKYRYVDNSGTSFSTGVSSDSSSAGVNHVIWDPYHKFFVAGLSNGIIEVSRTGQTWIQVFDSFPLLTTNAITRLATNGLGVIVYDGAGNVGHTTDLKTFTVSDLTNSWDYLVYIGGELKRWLLIDGNGSDNYFSTDGETWAQTNLNSPFAGGAAVTCGASDGNLAVVGNAVGQFEASLDGGETWTRVWAGGDAPNSLDVGDGCFLLSDDDGESHLSMIMPRGDLRGESWIRDVPLEQASVSYTDSVTEITSEQINIISNNIAQAADDAVFQDWALLLNPVPLNSTTAHAPETGRIIYDPFTARWVSFDDVGTSFDVVAFNSLELADGTFATTANILAGHTIATDGAGTIIAGLSFGNTNSAYARTTNSDVTAFTIVDGTAGSGVVVQCLIWDAVNGLFISGWNNSGVVETSPDGADSNWTSQTVPNTDVRTGIATSPTGVTVITAEGETSVIKSTNGTTWTEHSLPGASPRHVAWVGGGIDKFVTCDSSAIYASDDGETWSASGLATPSNDPDNGLVSVGRFLICDGEVSADGGVSWVSIPLLTDAVRVGDNQIVRGPGVTADWTIYPALS